MATKTKPASFSIDIGGNAFELLTTTADDKGRYLAAGAETTLPGLVSTAIAEAAKAAVAVEKSTGQSRLVGRALVGIMSLNRDGDGYPLMSRKVQPESYREMEDAIFAAAVPMPADTPANAEKRITAAQRLFDLKGAVKTELSRDLTEEAIVDYCLDAVQPGLSDEETKKLNKGGWQGGTPGANGRPAKLQIGLAPERLAALIKKVYAANDGLKLPKNLGGTKTIGTSGGNDKKLSKSKVTDLSTAATSIESGGISENGLADSLVTLCSAAYRRAASGEVSTGIEREKVATSYKVAADFLTIAGKIYAGTVSDTERSKMDRLAGVNAPEGVETGAETQEAEPVAA